MNALACETEQQHYGWTIQLLSHI